MSESITVGEEVTVAAGEVAHVRHPVGETYLGDPVELPVTVLNGVEPGPTVCLTAALHGDELNGVKVLQEVAARYDPTDLHGAVVCVHVCNVPGYQAQQRDVPIFDQDLNRAFPGSSTGTTASRMARSIYDGFVAPADLLVDFHTSTQNRTTMYHARADLSDEGVARLARAAGTNLTIDGLGETGSLRRVATEAGTPAVTIEMGKAHRFQAGLVDLAVAGIDSVLAEYGLVPDGSVASPAWRCTVAADGDKTWLRAGAGGLVEMRWGPQPLVHEGEPICSISDHFSQATTTVTAPFTGLLVGVLENPVALPGHPLCHLVRVDAATRREIEAEIERGEFDGYRLLRGHGVPADADA